jgi:hypothetical protein
VKNKTISTKHSKRIIGKIAVVEGGLIDVSDREECIHTIRTKEKLI